MYSLSKTDDAGFSKMFWRGFWIAVGGAAVISISAVLLGLVLYYSRIYGW